MKSWTWGRFQSSVYVHTPFSRIKPFDKLFERRIATGGSENTVSVAASEFEEKRGYQQFLGAGFRQVVALDQSHVTDTYMNSTGQSGNLLSRHYDDMIAPFSGFQYFQLNQASQQGSKQ